MKGYASVHWSMLRAIDPFYQGQPEPHRACVLVLRERILRHDARINEAWKYGMPFFLLNGCMFCYLWVHKQEHLPYIGFVDGREPHHPRSLQEARARMKTLLIDPRNDLPLTIIDDLLRMALTIRTA